MHNIKFIRENPEKFDAAMKERGLEPQAAKILELDKQVRGGKTELQDLQQQANTWAKKIGELKSKGEDASEAIIKSKELKAQVTALKKQAENGGNSDSSDNPVNKTLAALPNMPADDVPFGKTEDDNIEVRTWGEIPKFDFTPKEHFELGENLGLMDFEKAAKISGSRFSTLRGDLARLERALGNFMLETHTNKFGFEEVSPPVLVRDDAMFGSGQLPKFADDSFATTNGYRLIPTAEVPLVNMVRESLLEKEELPIRMVAHTPCFRSEAGSAGKDTRGLIRQHQFWKVEMVSITDKESSDQELERITNCAEDILQQLKLSYRVVKLCSQDMGFTARRTYDIELWVPGQNKYREVSSCSTCGDFQARRMNTKYKATEKDSKFVHTLNGSGLAVGRTLLAIMENYQNADGSITVPEVLRSYMGKDIIS